MNLFAVKRRGAPRLLGRFERIASQPANGTENGRLRVLYVMGGGPLADRHMLEGTTADAKLLILDLAGKAGCAERGMDEVSMDEMRRQRIRVMRGLIETQERLLARSMAWQRDDAAAAGPGPMEEAPEAAE